MNDVQDKINTLTASANHLIDCAEKLGVVITITLKPLEPLAMGNHKMVAEVVERKPY